MSDKNQNTILTVSEATNAIQEVLEGVFTFIHIQGEISSLTIASSGHVYFSLKDKANVIDVVCWKSSAEKLSFANGSQVICSGKITNYGPRSRYQLVLTRMVNCGRGDLLLKLEQLKQKLLSEGLFDLDKKKPLPKYPSIIGIITSPDGAVYHDIMHRVAERFPCTVLFYPTLVQGADAPRQIVRALQAMDILPPSKKPDVIILARGGGSLEDLLAFSDEAVVRSVAKVSIPIISAIGHETDVALTDFAADKRAPTPTAAAEMATPVLADLRNYLHQAHFTIKTHITQRLNNYQQGIDRASITINNIDNNFTIIKQQISAAQIRLYSAIIQALKIKQNKVDDTYHLLQACSHHSILSRGYVAVQGDNGQWIQSINDTKNIKTATVHFSDGVWGVRGQDGAVDF